MNENNVLLVINPVAGRRQAQSKLFQIVDLLTKNGCTTMIFTTAKKNDAIEIVKNHGHKAQRIICCGGDGTFSEVINGLIMAKLKVPVGYIPTGTTNDLANALNLPAQINKAINTAISGIIREHDIGRFNKKQYFTYVASFGAFTKAAYDTPQWVKNTIGPVSYIIGGVLQVGDIRPYSVNIIADDVEITGEFVFCSVSNSTVVGGIIKYPEADIEFDDGFFEVMLIKNPTTPIELGNILQGIISRQYNDNNVLLLKAKKLMFSFQDSVQWTIDGEYAGEHKTVYIENRHCAVQIIAAK